MIELDLLVKALFRKMDTEQMEEFMEESIDRVGENIDLMSKALADGYAHGNVSTTMLTVATFDKSRELFSKDELAMFLAVALTKLAGIK